MWGKASVVSLAALMGLSCWGCGNPFKSDADDYRIFQLGVDSVAVASPLRDEYGRLVGTTSPLGVPDTMRILFYGVINSFCPGSFSHFDTTRIEHVGYRVSVWGKERLRPGIDCPSYRNFLGPAVLVFRPPLRPDTWIFLVSQPDGSILRKEAVVR